jgi:hypothetical protein
MTSAPTDEEQHLLQRLDAAVRCDETRAAIAPIVARVEQTLARDSSAIEAWEPIPLDAYGERLPPEIRSSWVFILRGGVTTGAERHPNSHQRMISWHGHGDFQVNDGQQWRSHFLVSDMGAALEDRWISIPPNTWHQGVVSESDWVVVSFHTASAPELIEERPDPRDERLTRQRKYLEVQQA